VLGETERSADTAGEVPLYGIAMPIASDRQFSVGVEHAVTEPQAGAGGLPKPSGAGRRRSIRPCWAPTPPEDRGELEVPLARLDARPPWGASHDSAGR
jgi:hypothetical protein